MCEAGDEIDEYIVYELIKDNVEHDEDDQYQDTEVIEMAEDEEEEEEPEEDQKQFILASTVVTLQDPDEILGEDAIVELEGVQKLDVEEIQQLEEEYQDLDDDDEEEANEAEEQLIEEDGEEMEQLVDDPEQMSQDEDTEPETLLTTTTTTTTNSAKPVIAKSTAAAMRTTRSGPQRYLLFDDLIATVVDYDVDNTPIVEFAMSGMEADQKLPVECGICPDVMSKAKLGKHLKTHLVVGTNRYACIYCEETYKDYKYLAGHARRHMGIRPYVCEPCKLYFSTKQDLRVHNQRRHQVKEHICEVCGKTFAQNTQLKRHREATHEKKRRFQCSQCPKAYYKNFALQEHIRGVHLGNRRMLVCPFCGMQCRDAHKMARHRKELHLNQSHYECHICQEEFTEISYFDAHKRSIQCRNNTRRKLEEEEQQAHQQMEEHVVYEITLDSNENH